MRLERGDFVHQRILALKVLPVSRTKNSGTENFVQNKKGLLREHQTSPFTFIGIVKVCEA